MVLFSSLLAATLTIPAVPISEPCKPIPGWNEVVSDKNIRWIVLGEMHGTNEMPEIFADAACLTAEVSPTVVALELPEIDQPRIDAYLESDGGPTAKKAFLEAHIWNSRAKDGRSSEAVFRLFEQLHRWYKVGKVRAVIAFQPVRLKEPSTSAEYERAMADLIEKNTPKGFRALVLVGNVHARRTKVDFGPEPYLAMAGHLPSRNTLSLDISSNGVSSAWACRGPGQCGETTFGRKGDEHARGVVLTKESNEWYDGRVFLGTSTTASAPQSTIVTSP
jgi:hypothetical protein